MAIDNKYNNNVILNETAFQELLTNIKNYPIIDIDYINKSERDELHGDEIWTNYTDNTPCLKITYGDERTEKGNIMFATDEQKNQLQSLNKKLKYLKSLQNDCANQLNRWNKIWEQNKNISNSQLDYANKLARNLIDLDIDKQNFLIYGYYILNLFNWEYLKIKPDNFTISDEIKENYFYNKDLEFITKNIELQSENTNEKITYSFQFLKDLNSNNNIINSLETNILGFIDFLYGNDEDDPRVEVLYKFKDFIHQYNNLIFLDGIKGNDFNIDINNPPEEILEYINIDDYNPNYNFNEIRELFKAQIENILNDIKLKVDNNLIIIKNKIENLKNLLNWFEEENLNEGNITKQLDNGIILNQNIPSVQHDIDELKLTINNIVAPTNTQSIHAQHKLYGYKYIKLGNNINWDNNIIPAINPLDTEQNNGSFRENINGQTYEIKIKGLEESNKDNLVLSATNIYVIDSTSTPANSNITINEKFLMLNGDNLPYTNGILNENADPPGAVTKLSNIFSKDFVKKSGDTMNGGLAIIPTNTTTSSNSLIGQELEFASNIALALNNYQYHTNNYNNNNLEISIDFSDNDKLKIDEGIEYNLGTSIDINGEIKINNFIEDLDVVLNKEKKFDEWRPEYLYNISESKTNEETYAKIFGSFQSYKRTLSITNSNVIYTYSTDNSSPYDIKIENYRSYEGKEFPIMNATLYNTAEEINPHTMDVQIDAVEIIVPVISYKISGISEIRKFNANDKIYEDAIVSATALNALKLNTLRNGGTTALYLNGITTNANTTTTGIYSRIQELHSNIIFPRNDYTSITAKGMTIKGSTIYTACQPSLSNTTSSSSYNWNYSRKRYLDYKITMNNQSIYLKDQNGVDDVLSMTYENRYFVYWGCFNPNELPLYLQPITHSINEGYYPVFENINYNKNENYYYRKDINTYLPLKDRFSEENLPTFRGQNIRTDYSNFKQNENENSINILDMLDPDKYTDIENFNNQTYINDLLKQWEDDTSYKERSTFGFGQYPCIFIKEKEHFYNNYKEIIIQNNNIEPYDINKNYFKLNNNSQNSEEQYLKFDPLTNPDINPGEFIDTSDDTPLKLNQDYSNWLEIVQYYKNHGTPIYTADKVNLWSSSGGIENGNSPLTYTFYDFENNAVKDKSIHNLYIDINEFLTTTNNLYENEHIYTWMNLYNNYLTLLHNYYTKINSNLIYTSENVSEIITQEEIEKLSYFSKQIVTLFPVVYYQFYGINFESSIIKRKHYLIVSYTSNFKPRLTAVYNCIGCYTDMLCINNSLNSKVTNNGPYYQEYYSYYGIIYPNDLNNILSNINYDYVIINAIKPELQITNREILYPFSSITISNPKLSVNDTELEFNNQTIDFSLFNINQATFGINDNTDEIINIQKFKLFSKNNNYFKNQYKFTQFDSITMDKNFLVKLQKTNYKKLEYKNNLTYPQNIDDKYTAKVDFYIYSTENINGIMNFRTEDAGKVYLNNTWITDITSSNWSGNKNVTIQSGENKLTIFYTESTGRDGFDCRWVTDSSVNISGNKELTAAQQNVYLKLFDFINLNKNKLSVYAIPQRNYNLNIDINLNNITVSNETYLLNLFPLAQIKTNYTSLIASDETYNKNKIYYKYDNNYKYFMPYNDYNNETWNEDIYKLDYYKIIPSLSLNSDYVIPLEENDQYNLNENYYISDTEKLVPYEYNSETWNYENIYKLNYYKILNILKDLNLYDCGFGFNYAYQDTLNEDNRINQIQYFSLNKNLTNNLEQDTYLTSNTYQFTTTNLITSQEIIGYNISSYSNIALLVEKGESQFKEKVIIDNLTNTNNDIKETVYPTTANATLNVNGIGYFTKGLKASRVYNAVFNDYAECRKTINASPGHAVIDNDDGSLSLTVKRLQPGAQIISDTYGTLMGETDESKTPLAVAGRVLVYPYQNKNNYHAGMCVCSAPGGTVDIMTREEIKEYPDCIIGIVSEIPNYDVWGTAEIKVNNRIWIKVK